MRPAVLFDLGNTLAAYYRPDQFRPILETAITDLLRELQSLNLTKVTLEAALRSATAENQEAADFRFKPMADRLERIFDVALADNASFTRTLCEVFLRPIFAIGRLYEDTQPVLNRLRSAGHPTAIVSNAPWGSPPDLWRQELKRLGLVESVDCVVLCGDVGWRKPAREIFEFAARKLDRRPAECFFVGDDLHWDVSGSAAVGMHAILLDRDGRYLNHPGDRATDLHGVLTLVGVNP